MVELLTVPTCNYVGFDGRPRPLPTKTGSLLLVNLWSSSCRPCLAELKELSRRHDEIRAKGIEIIALSVDGLGGDVSESAAAARLVSSSKFPFTVGKATTELVENFQNLHDHLFPLRRRLPLPTSLLLDQHGRLAVIYKGPLSIDELLEDVTHSDGSRLERFSRSAPIAGRPISHPRVEELAINLATKVRFHFASGLQKAGRADQAAIQFTEVLKIIPDSADAHNNLGLALQNLGRIEEGMAHCQEALRLKPDFAEAHSNLGLAFQQRGRFEEAMAHYQEALRIKPDFAKAHYNLGLVWQLQGRSQQAMTSYGEALRLDPEYAEAHNNLGRAFYDLGRAEEAIAHYQEALRIQPDYAEAHNNLAWLWATFPDQHIRDGQRALEHAKRAAGQVGEDDPFVLETLAAAYAEVGDFEQAVRWQEKAVKMAAERQKDVLRGRLELYKQGKPYRDMREGRSIK